MSAEKKSEIDNAKRHPLWDEIMELVQTMKQDILKSHKIQLQKSGNAKGS